MAKSYGHTESYEKKELERGLKIAERTYKVIINRLKKEQSSGLDISFDTFHTDETWGVDKRLKGSVEKGQNHFSYIPGNDREFIKAMLTIKKQSPKFNSFIDIGSGLGAKPFIMRQLFNDVDITGIEYNKHTHRISKKIRQELHISNDAKKGVKFIKTNALIHNYSKYDLIYFYRPMSENRMMVKLLSRILETASPNTLIIDPYLPFPLPLSISNGNYLKGEFQCIRIKRNGFIKDVTRVYKKVIENENSWIYSLS